MSNNIYVPVLPANAPEYVDDDSDPRDAWADGWNDCLKQSQSILKASVDGSKTQQAIKWMVEQGCTPYAAAKKFGIAPVNVYRALKEQAKDKPRCECCGQVIRK